MEALVWAGDTGQLPPSQLASACRHGVREGCSPPESEKYLPIFLPPPALEGSLPLPRHLAPIYTPEHCQIFILCLNILFQHENPKLLWIFSILHFGGNL